MNVSLLRPPSTAAITGLSMAPRSTVAGTIAESLSLRASRREGADLPISDIRIFRRSVIPMARGSVPADDRRLRANFAKSRESPQEKVAGSRWSATRARTRLTSQM